MVATAATSAAAAAVAVAVAADFYNARTGSAPLALQRGLRHGVARPPGSPGLLVGVEALHPAGL